MELKYELTDEHINVKGKTLYRIRALKDFSDVKAGDLGGFVESTRNLRHHSLCWIYDDAKVYEDAVVQDDAKVFDKAQVYGNVMLYGNTKVYGNAIVAGGVCTANNVVIGGDAKVYGDICIRGNAVIQSDNDYIVFKNCVSSGRYFTHTFSDKKWNVGCFYGNSDELLEKAKKDGEVVYNFYKMCVDFVKKLEDSRS